VIHWLGRIKGAAAEVNGELGLLKPTLARKIAKAAAAIADGATTSNSRSTSFRPARAPRRT